MDQSKSIISLFKCGYSGTLNSKKLNIPASTVYFVISKFKQTGLVERSPNSGRPRSARTERVIKCVREKIRRNCKRSMRKLAREHNLRERTMR